jgi:hypothetical protein
MSQAARFDIAISQISQNLPFKMIFPGFPRKKGGSARTIALKKNHLPLYKGPWGVSFGRVLQKSGDFFEINFQARW